MTVWLPSLLPAIQTRSWPLILAEQPTPGQVHAATAKAVNRATPWVQIARNAAVPHQPAAGAGTWPRRCRRTRSWLAPRGDQRCATDGPGPPRCGSAGWRRERVDDGKVDGPMRTASQTVAAGSCSTTASVALSEPSTSASRRFGLDPHEEPHPDDTIARAHVLNPS
jgi:hypothetical protein